MNTTLRFAALLVLVIGLAACAQPTSPTVIGIVVSITATQHPTAFPPTGTPVPPATVPALTDTPSPRPPEPTLTAIPFQWVKVSALEFLQLQEKGLPEQCSQVLFNPFDEEAMYLIEYCPPNGSGALYRSLDRGATWQPATPNSTGLVSLQFDPDGKTIYGVGLDYVVLVSQDRGSTWRGFLQILPGHNQFLFADPVIQGRLYRAESYGGKGYSSYTEDHGQTWSAEFTHQPSGHNWWQNFPNMYFGQKNLFLVNDTDISRSIDRGVTWQACGEGGGNISSQTQLIIDPQDENHLLITEYEGQLMESVDGCQTWNNAGLSGFPVSSLVQGRLGSVYAATDAGVYVSFDSGKTWTALNTGLPVEPRIYSLAADPSDPSVIFAVSTQGLYRLER